MTSNYLIFLLSGRLFAVRLTGAIEILPWRKARQVPLAYSYVEGLIDYRDVIYPVFNVSQRLGLTKTGPIGFTAEELEAPGGAGRSIILLEENSDHFGIAVDSVVKMSVLRDPETVPDKTPGVDLRYVKGLVQEDDQDVIILDFERLLHAS